MIDSDHQQSFLPDLDDWIDFTDHQDAVQPKDQVQSALSTIAISGNNFGCNKFNCWKQLSLSYRIV